MTKNRYRRAQRVLLLACVVLSCGCGSNSVLSETPPCVSDYNDVLNVRSADEFWNPGNTIATFLPVLRRAQTDADQPPAGTSFDRWAHSSLFESGGGTLSLATSRRAWGSGLLSAFIATVPGHPDAICTEVVLDRREQSAQCSEGYRSAYFYDLAQVDCHHAAFVATVPADTTAVTIKIARHLFHLALQHQVAAAILNTPSGTNATITLRSKGVPAVRTFVERKL